VRYKLSIIIICSSDTGLDKTVFAFYYIISVYTEKNQATHVLSFLNQTKY